jgi:hypothetical protein
MNCRCVGTSNDFFQYFQSRFYSQTYYAKNHITVKTPYILVLQGFRKNVHLFSCNAAAHVRVQVRSSGICGGQSGTSAGFLLALRFPLPILNLPTAPHSSYSAIWGWYSRPKSGRHTNWTQSHLTLRIKNELFNYTICSIRPPSPDS